MSSQPSAKRPLSEQFKTLAEIQELDLQILSAQKELGDFPAQLKDRELKITGAQKSEAAVVAELEAARTQVATLKTEIQATRERLSMSRTRLETVRNQGQYQAVNREIEQMERAEFVLSQKLDGEQKKVSEIEARQLKAAEQVALALKAKETLVTLVNEAGNGAAARIEVLERTKAPLKAGVEPRIFSLYDRIRSTRAGIGVAAVVDGNCKACHRALPPQLLNELRKGEAHQQCSNCQRLIYLA